jgi:hypothetical protein
MGGLVWKLLAEFHTIYPRMYAYTIVVYHQDCVDRALKEGHFRVLRRGQ